MGTRKDGTAAGAPPARDVATDGGAGARGTYAGMPHKEAFGAVMCSLAERDPSLAVVVSDYGRRLGLAPLRATAPQDIVQCGIAEQSQVEVASALANEGLHTFMPGYATFVTSRVADQLRVCLGMMGSPMAVVGVSCGCDSGILGASHMALEDVALMRSIPGVEVLAPLDADGFAAALLSLAAHPRPAYMRMNDGDGTALSGTPLGGPDEGSLPGAWELLPCPDTPDVTLLGLGTIASRALEAGRLLAARGVPCRVVGVSRVRPLGVDALALSGGLVVTVEEHSIVGGLGSAVAEALAAQAGTPALLALGMPDRYLEADTRDALLARAGLAPEAIADAALARLAELPPH